MKRRKEILEVLTKRQEEILNYIKSFMVSHGYPPTVREIGKDLGLSSPATIHTHLNNLAKKGFIKCYRCSFIRKNYSRKSN